MITKTSAGTINRLKMRSEKQNVVTLASQLSSTVAGSSSIRCISQAVSAIGDSIPEQFRGAQKLFVGRNRLSSLEGIQQFTQLRALGLADNQLPLFESLAPLRCLPHLTAVTLQGNPLCELPSARARVIAYLGEQLTLLDGRAVTPEERLAAVRLCALQDAVVKIAASNARLALKLRRALQLSAVHRELHQKHFFGKKNGAAAPMHDTLTRLVNFWDMRTILGAAEVQRMEAAVFSHIASIWERQSERASSWRPAFFQALTASTVSVIEAAKALAEAAGGLRGQDAEAYASAVEAACAALEGSVAELLRLESPGGGTSCSGADRAQAARKEVLTLHAQLLNALRGDAADLDAQQRHESPLPKKPAVAKRNMDLAAQQAVVLEENAWLKLALKEAEQRAEALAASNRRAWQRAQDSETSLELHRKEAEAAQQETEALCRRLEKANQVAASAEEALSAETHRSASLHRDLNAVLTAAEEDRASLCDFGVQLAALQTENQQQQGELASLLHRQQTPVALSIAVSFEEELLQERAQANRLLCELHNTKARLAAVERQTESHWLAKKAQQERRLRLERLEGMALTRRCRLIAASGLAAWRQAAQRSRSLDVLGAKRQRAVVAATLGSWKAQARQAAVFRAMSCAAVSAANAALARRAFDALCLAAALHRQAEVPDDCPTLLEASLCRRHRALASALNCWRQTTQAAVLPRKALFLLSSAHREARALQAAFSTWRDAAATQREDAAVEQRGSAARRVILLRMATRGWRRHCRRTVELCVAEVRLAKLHHLGVLAAAWAAWRQHHSVAVFIAAAERERVLQEVVGAWRTWAAQCAAAKAIVAAEKAVVDRAEWGGKLVARQAASRMLRGWARAAAAQRSTAWFERVQELEAALAVAQSEVAVKSLDAKALCSARDSLSSEASGLAVQLSEVEAELAQAEAALEQTTAERDALVQENAEKAAAAEKALEIEREARWEAEEAAQASFAEADSTGEALMAALDRAAAAAARAAGAEEARAELEAESAGVLERFEAAVAVCERLQKERDAMHEEMEAAQEKIAKLEAAADDSAAQVSRLAASEQMLQLEAAGLRRQIAVVRKEWRGADEAKSLAEDDAREALRQAQRLAELVERRAVWGGGALNESPVFTSTPIV